MTSQAHDLVRRINQFLGGGSPHWNGQAKRLAEDYQNLFGSLAERYHLAKLHLELEDVSEARKVFSQPFSLVQELRALQFPRRWEWERFIRSQIGSPTKPVTLDDVVTLEKQLAAGAPPESPTHGLQRHTIARHMAREVGFADSSGSVLLRMLPLVGLIVAMSLGLLLLAVVGPSFFREPQKPEPEGINPEDLAGLGKKPAEGNPPGQAIPAALPKEKGPLARAPKADAPKDDPRKPDLPPAQPEAQVRAGPEKPAPKKDDLGGLLAPPAQPVAQDEPKPLPPGFVRGPEVEMVHGWLEKYLARDDAARLKHWLQLNHEMASKEALEGLLKFIRADMGLLGKKPPLDWLDLQARLDQEKTLNQTPRQLFDRDRLQRMTRVGKVGEFELVDWFATVVKSDQKALQFFTDKPSMVHAEALFAFAANVDRIDEFTRFLDTKVIEYEGGRPKRLRPYITVILKEKREMKELTDEGLLKEVVAINSELKRRVQSARYPWKDANP